LRVIFRRGTNRRLPDRAERLASAKRLSLAVLRAAAWIGGTAAAAGIALWTGQEVYRWATTAPLFQIKELVVTNESSRADHLAPDRIRAVSGLTLGENIFQAKLWQARIRLGEDPWIRSATLTREFPHRVQIRVEQRRAIAYVDLSGLYVIDDRGQIFKRASWEDQLDLPIVTGLSRKDFIAGKTEVREQIESALSLIVTPPGMMVPWDPKELSEVHFDEDLGVTLELGELPTAVELGFPPFEDKLDRLRRARGELQRRQLQAEALYLDDSRQPDHVGMALAGPDPLRTRALLTESP
jgi:cell division protein FtsQ